MKMLILLSAIWLASTNLNLAEAQPVAAKPFVVVELFVSESCSDCPPADEFLSQLTQFARSNHQSIYPLSFQVDYWNNSEWSDPFSNPIFTQRQQQYAAVLPGGVYTPEMIINGKEAFVGSDEGKAKQFIDHYLSLPAENDITLNLDESGADLKVNYLVSHPENNAVIHFALVERGLVSHVTGGENGGRTLTHDNLVREFKTIDFQNVQGSVVFTKPQGVDLTRFSIIAYLQSQKDMSILAALGVDLQ